MAKTLISTHTASASATLDITSGIDSTYPVYEFHFVNMHPATDNKTFLFQVNAAGASGFNETITSTYFRAKHNEDDSATGLGYTADFDQAQGTAYQVLPNEVGADADQSTSGVLTLYAPSSTTYVKHFTARFNDAHPSNIAMDCFIAGYINVTAAIDEISFKFDSGNIDDGVIKMFGVS
jgi:hypothetical protein